MFDTFMALLGARRKARRKTSQVPGFNQHRVRRWVRMPGGELLPMLSAEELAKGARQRASQADEAGR